MGASQSFDAGHLLLRAYEDDYLALQLRFECTEMAGANDVSVIDLIAVGRLLLSYGLDGVLAAYNRRSKIVELGDAI